jgi:hypothetical protein
VGRASGTASDDLARRISMTTVCMGGIEPTWPLPFKSNVNIRLTVRLSWEVCQNQLLPWALSHAGAERGGFATPVLQVRRKRRYGEVRVGGMEEQDAGTGRRSADHTSSASLRRRAFAFMGIKQSPAQADRFWVTDQFIV